METTFIDSDDASSQSDCNLDLRCDEENDRTCENTDEYIGKLRTIISVTRDGKWQAVETASRYRKKLQLVSATCGKMKKTNQLLHFNWTKLKEDSTRNHKILSEEMDRVVHLIQTRLLKYVSDQNSDCEGCSHLQALQIQMEGLLVDDDKHRQQVQELSQEIQSLWEKLRLKSEEARKLQVQVRSKEEICQNSITKLSREVQLKQELITKQAKDIAQLHALYSEHQKTEQDTLKRASKSKNESELMKSLLQQAHADLGKVRIERDAHLGQLEALRMETTELLQKERCQMQEEFFSSEENIQRQFYAKLEHEKASLHQLLQQHVTDYRENEAKLMSHLKSTNEKHRDKVKDLQQQLRQTTVDREGVKADLESHLAKCPQLQITSQHEDGPLPVVQTCRPQVPSHPACDKCQASASLKEDLVESKAKVSMLQLTVEQECDERMVLTQQLSEAQREIIFLKRLLGNKKQGTVSKERNLSKPPAHLESHSVLHARRSSGTGLPLASEAGFVDFNELKQARVTKRHVELKSEQSEKFAELVQNSVNGDSAVELKSMYGEPIKATDDKPPTTIFTPASGRQKLNQSKKMLNSLSDIISHYRNRLKDPYTLANEEPSSAQTKPPVRKDVPHRVQRQSRGLVSPLQNMSVGTSMPNLKQGGLRQEPFDESSDERSTRQDMSKRSGGLMNESRSKYGLRSEGRQVWEQKFGH